VFGSVGVPSSGGAFLKLNFMDVIIHRSGKVFYSDVPTVNQTGDIARLHNLPRPDGKAPHPDFAALGFAAQHGRYDDPNDYSILPPNSRPNASEMLLPWPWVYELQEKIDAELREVVAKRIVRTHVDLLAGGVFVLTSGARVNEIRSAAVRMMGDAYVKTAGPFVIVASMGEGAKIDCLIEPSIIRDVKANFLSIREPVSVGGIKISNEWKRRNEPRSQVR
jgi:hypothetical protein